LLFEDLPLETKILIGLLAPMTLTLICWLVGPILTGWRNWARKRSWPGFWLMLLAAYFVFAIAGGLSFFRVPVPCSPAQFTICAIA
jgi:hypothetical protein